MSLKKCIIAAGALLLSASVASAAEWVIPVVATGPGANGSQWESEITLHNAGSLPISVGVAFQDFDGRVRNFETPLTIAPRATVNFQDIAHTFGLAAGTGALVIDTDDVSGAKLAITSRTFNTLGTTELGQDIPAIPLAEAAAEGDTAVITGPSDVASSRFNFGVYPIDEVDVEWTLLRKNGTVAATVTRTYGDGKHTQHNNGVQTLFGATSQDNDVVQAKVTRGRAMFYGSAINNASGDPTFVPAIRTRPNLSVVVAGLDMNEDGVVDVADTDHNGLIDAQIQIPTARFPTFFRIIAADPEGANLTYTLMGDPEDVSLVGQDGTVQWFPAADKAGETGSIRVRVSDGTDFVDVIISALFV
jgi:opacity protein-like surface antigen